MATAKRNTRQVAETVYKDVVEINVTLTPEEAVNLAHLLYTGTAIGTMNTLNLGEVSRALRGLGLPQPTAGGFDTNAYLMSDREEYERSKNTKGCFS